MEKLEGAVRDFIAKSDKLLLDQQTSINKIDEISVSNETQVFTDLIKIKKSSDINM